MSILHIEGATKRFGGFTAINKVNLEVKEGDSHAVIGPNGAGKTTLFNLVSGLIAPDEGAVSFRGQRLARLRPHEIVKVGMARSFQKVNIFPRKTALENVQIALIAKAGLHYNAWRDAVNVFRPEALRLLALVKLDGDADRPAAQLAHGKQKQVELAVALAAEPKMLLLDEPTAGMSIAETRASIQLIKEIVAARDLTLLFTEHDMAVVFEIASTISVLHLGEIIASGAPQAVREDPEVKRIYLGKD